LISVLSLGEQHMTGVFPKSREESIRSGPLELVKCHGDGACGLLQLTHSYPSSELYGATYGYRSGLNKSMVDHLQAKVESLLQRIPVREGDLVLDIGSNDGTLLGFYPENLLRLGMDPSAEKFLRFYKPGIELVVDFFSKSGFESRFGERKARIVTSIAMFYDLEDPIGFAAEVASVLADDGVWHFEQSYMPTMLEVDAYDTVCHEHLEYYGLAQIEWILGHVGLQILDVELNRVNGGSFAVTVAKKGTKYGVNEENIQKIREIERKARLETLDPYHAFQSRVASHRDRLLSELAKLKAQGAKILGYGASTKGNVILQYCGITSEMIPYIAEVNPDKFGSFTPGTGIAIISEKEAHAVNPDYFLVLPWHFRDNLIARESEFISRGGKMIFPLPQLEIFPQ
jgi:hypothetical protein